MAIRINRERLNDAMSKMMSFYMQNKLGELSNQRYMGTISEQDRLMRERQAEEDVRARQYQSEGSRLRIGEAFQKGLLDAVKDPGIDSLRQRYEITKMTGDTQSANALKEEYAQKVTGFINASIQAQGGQPLSNEQIAGFVDATDTNTTMDLLKEGGVNRRFAAELPIQRQQANTSAGNLALQREKSAREVSGEIPQTEYAKTISTKVQKAMDNINSVISMLRSSGGADGGYDVSSTIQMIEQGGGAKLVGGAITPQNLARLYSELSSLETLAMTKKLSPEQLAKIDNSVNVFGAQETGTTDKQKYMSYLIELGVPSVKAQEMANAKFGGQ